MKKTLSIILLLVMLVTMLPTFAINAFAKEKLETPILTINGAVFFIQ